MLTRGQFLTRGLLTRDRLLTRGQFQRVEGSSRRDRLLTRGQFQRVEGFQGTVPGDRLFFVRDSECYRCFA